MEDDARKPNQAVGYGRPPEDTRFKKGQSGNPRGRPKGSKSWKTLVHEVLDEKITINVRGKRRRILRKRALAIQAANVAMTKNDLTMLKAMGAFDEPAEAPQQATEDEIIPWRCTLVFDSEPQLTYENGEVVIDHRGARFKDSDESDWL
jgi:hypothetical protein